MTRLSKTIVYFYNHFYRLISFTALKFTAIQPADYTLLIVGRTQVGYNGLPYDYAKRRTYSTLAAYAGDQCP